MKKIILALAFIVFKAMMKAATPFLRNFVIDKIKEIERAAANTPNKWDDVLAEALHHVVIGND